MSIRPQRALARTLQLFVAPLALYAGLWALLTWPAAASFSTHFFADAGDGLNSVWNVWWFGYALAELDWWPWTTPLLFHPAGTTLVAHVLTPVNGAAAMLLTPFLTLVQAFNVLVVGAFAGTGVAAFWLAYRLTRAWFPAFLAGALFTFSSYHFAHAQGHLNLVTLQWLPVFALALVATLQTADKRWALAAGVALFLVQMSDPYYFVYAVLLTAVVPLWALAARPAGWPVVSRRMLAAAAVFGVVAGLLCGPLILAFYGFGAVDPLTGWHPSENHGMDFLAPFVYGGHWRFGHLTAGYWSRIDSNVHENSVHFGVATILLAAAALWRAGAADRAPRRLLLTIFGFFFVLALGPEVEVWGRRLVASLPYRALAALFPVIDSVTVPIRAIVVSHLALAALAAFGARRIAAGRRGRLILAAIVGLAALEHWPSPQALTGAVHSAYVEALAAAPDGAVVETTVSDSVAMYHQTRHRKPIAFGLVSRTTASRRAVAARQKELLAARDFAALYERHGLRYVVMPASAAPEGYPAVFDDGAIRVLDLAPGAAGAGG